MTTGISGYRFLSMNNRKFPTSAVYSILDRLIGPLAWLRKCGIGPVCNNIVGLFQDVSIF